jgi:RNA recognition motif-containing protein
MSGLLFVGGLPLHACDQNLTRYFRRFGPLDSAGVQRRPTGRSKGYAFIQFMHPADALKVLQTEHTIMDQKVTVRVAKKPNLDPAGLEWNPRSTRTVLVQSIPIDMDLSQFIGWLSRYIKVEHFCPITVEPFFKTKQCYVIPKTVKEANKIIQMGQIFIEEGLTIEFKALNAKQNLVGAEGAQWHPSAEDIADFRTVLTSKSTTSYQKAMLQQRSEPKNTSLTVIQPTQLENVPRLNRAGIIKLRKNLCVATLINDRDLESEQNYIFRVMAHPGCSHH